MYWYELRNGKYEICPGADGLPTDLVDTKEEAQALVSYLNGGASPEVNKLMIDQMKQLSELSAMAINKIKAKEN